jgi:outer membrane protein TolC
MKRITLLFIFFSGVCFGQNSLYLDSCIQMARRNYPLIKQNKLIAENVENALKTDNKNWLPKLSFISKAAYQSEVVEFLGKSFPHDSYLTALDLEQTLYDGGQIREQKRLDQLNNETDVLKNEVELYKLIDRITQLYSNILLLRENNKTLNVYKDDIDNKKNILSASVANGLMLQSNMDALEAEELKTEQLLIEVNDNLRALYQIMSMFINKTVDDNTDFSTQPVIMLSGNEINRPELKLFDSQKSMLEARHKLSAKSAFPKLAISAEGAYGRPGPNFLNQDLRFFGQAAISLKWNIGALYNLSNERQNINISKQMVDIQKEVFEFNIKTTLFTQNAQINSLRDIIEKDRLIIEKRHHIRETASKQFESGTITSTDYLSELNAEMQATLNEKVHEIKLMNAITNYNTTKGINNF